MSTSSRLLLTALLFLVPTLAFSQQAPPVPDTKPTPPAGVEERQVQFPTDGLMDPGTLTLPSKHSGKVPIAVMVQGSGVQDRDSTIGPNKIFQQFAWGLAQRGIATLRYDRRPKFDPASMKAHMDLDHEIVIDAASALAYCDTLSEIDPAKVFLLGHSLGAEMAPDIVAVRLKQRPASVRGMILMSGVARPIDVVILDQMRTLGKAQGGTQQQIDSLVAAWTAVFTAARDPKTPDSELLGVPGMGQKIPASYWRDWLRREPLVTLATLPIPTLVLRGTNDLNSTHQDFEMLQKTTTAHGSAGREFIGLNHEYIATNGDGRGASIAGQVSTEALDTIAHWIITGRIE